MKMTVTKSIQMALGVLSLPMQKHFEEISNSILVACQAEADDLQAAVQAEREACAAFCERCQVLYNSEERRKARLETADDIFRILLASDKDQQVISWLRRYIDDLAYRETPEGKEGQ